jgi:hypothetical protein
MRREHAQHNPEGVTKGTQHERVGFLLFLGASKIYFDLRI